MSSPARRSVAEEARALVAGAAHGTLATIAADGHPWASLVAYGTLPDGSPVLCLSALAEHGRNLAADPRASLLVAAGRPDGDPLEHGRVTLAGGARRPASEAERDAARAAYLAAVPGADRYVDLGDFELWVLHVDRLRWVGGFGRMGSEHGGAYRAVR